MAAAKTVVVRNLSEFTREEQVHALFSMVGRIDFLRMGLFSDTKTPAGFCFVVFMDADAAREAVLFLDRCKLDDAKLEVAHDVPGFTEGRQFRVRKGGGVAGGPSPGRKSQHEALANANHPESWIQESNHEGTMVWRNVRTFEICYTTPVVISQLPAPPLPCWDRIENPEGVCYMHKVTGEIIRPFKPQTRSSELYNRERKRGPDLSMEVSAENTALGKKVLEFTVQDLIERAGHMGSTRSIFDRKKFWRDFRLVEERGEVVLERVRNGEIMSRLSYYEAEIFSDNPHIQQVFANGREFIRLKREMRASDRYASPDLLPRTAYQRRQGEAKTVEHWGQRKLLLSEIEFLTLHAHKATVCLYAGAAPGTHINYLSEVLFPDMQFVLVDPAAFECRQTDRIQIRNTFFNDAIAEEYAGQELLFICDIRSTDIGVDTNARGGKIAGDMVWQEKWIKTMRPKSSMIKFTLPYCPPPGTTKYLDGDLYMPVFGGRTSTECRLMVEDPDSFRDWDHEEYEAYMFHHNTITRTSCFDVSLPRQKRREVGLCRCYDCASEVYIVSTYLKAFRGFNDDSGTALEDEVLRLSAEFSAVCSTTNRSLRV